jgi:ketosteroid isomerase-like protein
MRLLPLYALSVIVTASAADRPDVSRLAVEVRSAEQAFARSMAERDLKAFASYLDPEAVFFSDKVLRGKAAVVEGWKAFFDQPDAPFSWEPAQVEVLDSGRLAISSGPVRNPEGKQVGAFNSIWRRDREGQWKVIFDKGCPPCDCKAARSPAATD